ncbi:MAG: hypothetical protein WC740_16920 [Verrucomicrobiia bacterium]
MELYEVEEPELLGGGGGELCEVEELLMELDDLELDDAELELLLELDDVELLLVLDELSEEELMLLLELDEDELELLMELDELDDVADELLLKEPNPHFRSNPTSMVCRSASSKVPANSAISQMSPLRNDPLASLSAPKPKVVLVMFAELGVTGPATSAPSR